MKKIISLLIALSMMAGIFASENTRKIQSLIQDGVEKNADEISSLTSELSDAEKELIYTQNEIPWWPVFLNAFVGFGVGSYIQGDKGEAVRATICDSIALAGISVCYVGLYSTLLKNNIDIADDPNRSQELSQEELVRELIPWTAGMISFATFASISSIISIVHAVKYPLNKNEVLRNTLFATKASESPSSQQKMPDLAFAPIFSLNQDLSLAPGLVCKINF